jgi:hypothetical protein
VKKPSLFSHNKAKLDALLGVEKSIAVELRTYVNHLQTVQLSYDIIQKQNVEILKLLAEIKNNGFKNR